MLSIGDKALQMNKWLLIIVIIMLNNCASVMSPDGGPLDETPPIFLGTKPEILTSIRPEEKITIRLSEYLKESSIKNAIKVYPMHVGDVRYEFRGDKIDVWLPKELHDNTTYVLVLNTKLSDEHGVSIEKDISIPFTIDSIFDSSKIEGNVYGNFDQAAILLWRGKLNHESIASTSPDYVVTTTDDFEYIFNYLPKDNFSILAVEQYGSNIDYSKGKYAFYHKNSISTKESNLINIDFFIHESPALEELGIDSLSATENNNKNIVKTANISGIAVGKFLYPIKILLQNSSHAYVNAINLDGSYAINDVIEGKYQLLIYEDRNNNNKLDTGSLINKTSSEEFYIYPDSLSCRANWKLELPSWKYQKDFE